MLNKILALEKRKLSHNKEHLMCLITQNKNFTAEMKIHISIKCMKVVLKEKTNVKCIQHKVNYDLLYHIFYQTRHN